MKRSALRTGSLNWTDSGWEDMRALLLLHSLGTDLTMWEPQLEAFSSVRRVVAIHLPGHGGSTANPGEYRLEELGRDVLDVAGEAGLERFDVLGISLGGLIALWLAVNEPHRVISLVAANTAAKVGTAQLWSDRIEAVKAHGMSGISGQVVPRWLTSDFPQRHPETFRALEATFASVDPTGYIGCCAALRDADLREHVSTIACPTLIIGGEQDVATPPAESRWLGGQIRGSRVEIIPGAAHLANLDQPEAFTEHAISALSATV